MIPGRSKPPTLEWFRRKSRVCQVVGCQRKARHSWAYPCAITTMEVDPALPRWIVVCDECDIELNRALLAVVGVPERVSSEIIAAYRLIQGDAAFDMPVTVDDEGD